MNIGFRKTVAILVAFSLAVGILTGCRKPSDSGITENVSTGVTEPSETGELIVTDVPVPNEDQEVKQAPEKAEIAEAEESHGSLIPEDSSKDEMWNFVVRELNDFLSGEGKACALNWFSTVFKAGESYNIYEIGRGFELELKEMFADDQWCLDSMNYAVIDCGYDGIPDLAVTYTYCNLSGYDEPYSETMVFTDDMGWLSFVGSFTNYYREFSTINEAGYCVNGGSTGASTAGFSYYYCQDYGYCRFMYSENDIFGLTEAKIPSMYLPSDTAITPWEEDYSDHGGFLEIFSFSEGVTENDYDAYLRDCYFTFADFDGNPVMADAEYIAECAADGIRIVSAEELKGLIAEKEDEYYLTEEIKNAPEVVDWTPVPEEAWSFGKGVFGNLKIIEQNSDIWLDNDEEYDTCYAVADMDFNGRYEIIRAVTDSWTGNLYLSFYEVDSEYTGLSKLDYEEQFTYDGAVDGAQPDMVNSDDIRMYPGLDGSYYYVVPTSYVYDTFAATNVVSRNEVLKKTIGEDRIEYEGYTGGVEWYTTYNTETDGAILDESVKFYRWDDTECTEVEFDCINMDYFDFHPDGYNVMYFNFIPMIVDSEDDEPGCFRYLLESFDGWGGKYVYSPDGQ